MDHESEIKPLLTVKDVAKLLNVHINTVRRWSDQGTLKAYRINKRGDRRFRKEDIAYFLADFSVNDNKRSSSKYFQIFDDALE